MNHGRRGQLALAIHLSLCGAAASSYAQPNFTPASAIATTANGATSVFAADVDGDGDTDVLSASINDDKIAWYENDGAENFTLRTISSSANSARSVFAADVDGDGDTDVLSASAYDNKIAWYENDGAENFTLRTISVSASGAQWVFAADVDGDGNTDVLSASFNDDKIAWYENDGAENFTLRTISTSAAEARAVFAADVDGDGDTDVLSASRGDDKIAWYENDGAENFTLRTLSTSANAARAVFAADVDGDGDTDVLSASNLDDKIAWYENDGAENFTLRTLSTSANGARSVFAADVDGDGDTDVLSASDIDDKVAWYENDGAENFTLRTISVGANGAHSVFAADVDGDGDTDVLSASNFDDKIAWYENDGRDAFTPIGAPNTVSATANGAHSVFTADVDGDGDTDLLSASAYDNKIAWYENDGGQNFTLRTLSTSAAEARAVFAADVDGDGDTDVLSASTLDDKIAWYQNDGAENFTLRTLSTSADGAHSVFAADVDGDGDTDVLSASTLDDKIAWYQNDGAENFTLRTLSTSADGAHSVFAADVDGDGDTDVLSASAYDNKIAWYENDGAENFTLRTLSTSAAEAHSVFATDVDGDGDTDVLSASTLDDKIAWYQNDGAENFTLRTLSTSADGAHSVFAADVDGDGDADVLAASNLDDKIAWYQNDGAETFTLRTLSTSADGAHSVFAADVDGDGDTDVLSASGIDDKIAWYENQTIHRSGAFDATRTLNSGANDARNVFAADVDGDGDTDVLSASSIDDKIAWYENDGTENFTLRTISVSANGAASVFAADVDGDGDTDALSASVFDDKIAWYENDGAENFTLRTLSTSTNSARSVFAADVDGDGDTDVLSASAYDNKIAWYENDGAENFTLRTISVSANGAQWVFAADVDGDGDTDVLSASFNDDKIAWYENDGAENFTLRTISTSAAEARAVFAADVDGDGDTDVLSASRGDDKIAWYENDGAETFTLRTLSTSADAARSVFAADVDGDGDTDVLSASALDDKIAWYENDGAQNFTLRTLSTGANGAHSVFAADVDGDGDTDVLSASSIDDKIAWYDNCGGQFLVGGEGGGGQRLLQGESVQLLTLDYLHNGRAGDSPAVLDSLPLQFSDDSGNWLNSAQANALLDQITVYLDDGDLVFEPGVDLVVGSLNTLSLTPVALTQALQIVPLSGVSVPATDSARLFVEALFTADAASATPNALQVTARQTPLPRPQSSDANSDSVLSLECAMNAVSGVVSIGSPIAVNLSLSAASGAEASADMITVTATADSAVFGDQTVDLASSGTATLTDDYTLNTTQITIPDGQTTGMATFTVVDDALLEGAEAATLTLQNLSDGLLPGATLSRDIVITDDDAASVSIDDVIVAEDGATATFTVTLTGAVQDGFTVNYATSDGSAEAGQDYTANSGTLTFAGTPGETQSVQIAITDDAVLEPDETFDVTLSLPTEGVTLGTATGTGTISANDAASVSIDDVIVAEDGATATFTATLTGAVQDGFTVNYATADGTAEVGQDYAANSGTLTFAGTPGETQTVQISIVDDVLLEPDETFDVNLSLPTQGVTLGTATGTGTISNDDAASVSIDDVIVAEDGATATFTVSLVGAVQDGFTVNYATADGSAEAGEDYTANSGTLTFAGTPGETQTIQVTLIDDMLLESDETFDVTLSLPTQGVTLGTATGTGTISANDAASVSIDDVIVAEDGATATFTATLTGAVQDGFTVNYATADGSAEAGQDYTANSGTLTFAGTPGETQTVQVAITDDAVLEPDETFDITLSMPTQGVVLGTATGTGTISANDAASVSIDDVIVAEDGGTATFTATLTGAVQDGFTVNYATADGSAEAGEDYGANSGTLTFAGTPGETQTVQISIVDDVLLEPDETFDVNLSLPTQGVTLGTATGTGTISANDAASVSIDDVIVAEDGATATFTVSLTGAVQDGFTVNYATADDSAEAGEDYTANSGTLTFAGTPGETQTVQIAITDDAVLEPDETFEVTLSLPTQGVTLGTATGTGTLSNDDAASVSIDDVIVAEDGATATFTATLTGAVQDGFTVNYATADGSAEAGEDYTANSGTLTFAGTPGETQTVQVAITDDAVLEPDENFDITLNLPTQGVMLGTATGTGTISANDAASVSIDDVMVAEGGTATFTATLTGAVQDGFTVNYATSDGSAEAGEDYTANSGTLTFAGAPGETQTVQISTVNDMLFEPDETFDVTLSLPTQGVTLGTATGTGTISANDAASVSIDDVIVAEDGATATFTVSLTGAVQDGFAVNYATADGSAEAGEDYTANSGTLTFAGTPGETQTVQIAITDDAVLEPDETFEVTLSLPTQGVVLGTATGTGTVSNNDAASVSIDDVMVAEDGSVAVFTATLTGAVQDGFTVNYATVDGSAVAGEDYVANGGALLFAGSLGETQTVQVTLIDDALAEADETFNVALSLPTRGVMLGTATGTGTIADNEEVIFADSFEEN